MLNEERCVGWVVMNGMCVIDFAHDGAKAERVAREMQRKHDLSGSMAAFHAEPVFVGTAASAAPAEGRRAVDELAAFEREHDRYFVIKRKDLDIDQLRDLVAFIEHGDIPMRKCVVVEQDWPEYEPVWSMIETRVAGRAALASNAEGLDRIDFEKRFGIPVSDRQGNQYKARDNQNLWCGWQARAALATAPTMSEAASVGMLVSPDMGICQECRKLSLYSDMSWGNCKACRNGIDRANAEMNPCEACGTECARAARGECK